MKILGYILMAPIIISIVGPNVYAAVEEPAVAAVLFLMLLALIGAHLVDTSD